MDAPAWTPPDDVLTRPAPPPDFTIRYGPAAEHIADVRLPCPAGGVAAPPLVIFVHGGFWRARYDRLHTGPLTAALAAAGYVVCVPEFRRTGQPGGGWPGTFDDVATAVDRLPALLQAISPWRPPPGQRARGEPGGGAAGARACAAGTAGAASQTAEPQAAAEQQTAAGTGRLAAAGPPLLAGHSAGGHLALWAAARHRLPPASPWHHAGPCARGVVALAAVSLLTECHDRGLGDGAAAVLMGGTPDRYPERYQSADPGGLLPLGCPVRLVHGTRDTVVPLQLSRAYAARARQAGDDTTLAALPGSSHFDVIDPLSPAWRDVLAAVTSLDPPAAGAG
jgi:acetyl esterase/lipase